MSSNQKNDPVLDFDEWSTLAKNNPQSFEKKRLEMIESFLVSVPEEKQRRLRGLQWQIDQARHLAHSPMGSCIAISNMMWDSLNELNTQQRKLTGFTDSNQSFAYIDHEQAAATVLPFSLRRR